MSNAEKDFDINAWEKGTPTTTTAQAAPDFDVFKYTGEAQPTQDNSPAHASGEITNDVGNGVTWPKPGESFRDTMARAAAKGKTTTQAQIDAEMKSAPGKVATVLGAAPLIGAGGTAALAAPGLAPEAAEALMNLAKAHPVIASIVKKGMGAAGFGAVAGMTEGMVRALVGK